MTVYEMRISDWSSDVFSSDLFTGQVSIIPCHAVKGRRVVGLGNAESMRQLTHRHLIPGLIAFGHESELQYAAGGLNQQMRAGMHFTHGRSTIGIGRHAVHGGGRGGLYGRSEEHTSELQSLMRISYAVFCLKKKKQYNIKIY